MQVINIGALTANIFTGDTTFYFRPGNTPFDEWRMTMGSDASGQGLFDSGVVELNSTAWEQTFGPMPDNGETLTLRFWQRNQGGEWATFDTVFSSENNNGEPPPGSLATFSYPFAGDVLSADSTTLYFSPGTAVFDEWRITIGTGPDAQSVHDSNIRNLNQNPWQQTFGPMPQSGPLYVRWWQRNNGGSWATFDTIFQTQGSSN